MWPPPVPGSRSASYSAAMASRSCGASTAASVSPARSLRPRPYCRPGEAGRREKGDPGFTGKTPDRPHRQCVRPAPAAQATAPARRGQATPAACRNGLGSTNPSKAPDRAGSRPPLPSTVKHSASPVHPCPAARRPFPTSDGDIVLAQRQAASAARIANDWGAAGARVSGHRFARAHRWPAGQCACPFGQAGVVIGLAACRYQREASGSCPAWRANSPAMTGVNASGDFAGGVAARTGTAVTASSNAATVMRINAGMEANRAVKWRPRMARSLTQAPER